jgi:hypothetical protein
MSEGPAAEPPKAASRLGAILRAPLRLVLALIILFEEWGWEPLQRLMARIARLPVLRQLEALIARLPPYAALAVFFVPTLALFPVKIGALWLIARGQKAAGLVVLVIAKLVGTAVLARLFALTRPALMQLAWFAKLFEHWSRYKAALVEWVRASAVWRRMHVWRVQMREAMRAWRQRWFGTGAP